MPASALRAAQVELLLLHLPSRVSAGPRARAVGAARRERGRAERAVEGSGAERPRRGLRGERAASGAERPGAAAQSSGLAGRGQGEGPGSELGAAARRAGVGWSVRPRGPAAGEPPPPSEVARASGAGSFQCGSAVQPRSSGARSKSAERGTGGVRSYGVHLHPGKNSEDWQRGVLALGAGSSEKDREGGGRSGGVLARPREPPSISAEMALGTK